MTPIDQQGHGENSGPVAAQNPCMVTRFLLMLGGLIAVGAVGAFLFYLSVLTIVTTLAILVGLVATLVLGYWAGSISLDPSPKSHQDSRQ